MTYCVGLRLDRGLVFMSDTRTNAGLDNISTFRKMFTWADDGETYVTILTAGNLATTQSVVSLIDDRAKAPSERHPAILQLPSMFQIARYVGTTLREVIVLRVFEELSFEDIAEAVGSNAVAVRKRYSRALQELRDRLGAQGATA